MTPMPADHPKGPNWRRDVEHDDVGGMVGEHGGHVAISASDISVSYRLTLVAAKVRRPDPGAGCGYQESEVSMVMVAACRLAVMLAQTWWRSSSHPSARQPSPYRGPLEVRCQP
jgi:hypothetical protein